MRLFSFTTLAAASLTCFSVSCGSGTTGSDGKGGGTSDTTTDVTTSGAGAAGGTGGAGGGPTESPAALCPELDPYHPGPNSVAVQGTVLEADDHWTSDKVYLIFDDFKIEGHTLTVDAGTTICLSNQGKIFVGEGIEPGEIHLNGTAEKPVTLTAFASSSDPTKPDGPHGGIQFDTYEGSTLSYVDIWYGGPGGGSASYAFELTDTARGDDPDGVVPLLLDHLTIGEVQSNGFRIGTENGVDPASEIRFTGFAPHTVGDPDPVATAVLNYYAVKSVTGALTYDDSKIPAAARRIDLVTASPPLVIHDDVEITDAGLPYFTETGGLTISAQETGAQATLTVDAGVTMHMHGELLVGDTNDGNLVLAGTAAKPVVLTSSEDAPAPGDWEGIFFSSNRFDSAKSKIDHAQILYAGVDDPLSSTNHVAQCGTTYLAAVAIAGTQLAYAGPVLSNTLIAHSLSNGIASDAGTDGTHVTTDYADASLGLTFEDIGGANLVVGACP